MSLVTLVVFYGIIALANFSSAPEGKERLSMFALIGFFLLIDATKWVAYYKISVKYKNSWSIFYILYIISLVGITILLPFNYLYLVVLFYVLTVLMIYSDNKKNVE